MRTVTGLQEPAVRGGEDIAPRLAFGVEAARAEAHSAAPTIVFRLRITARDASVRSLSVEAQLRIAAMRRQYTTGEKRRLVDLFGKEEDWGRTAGSLFWTRTAFVVPAFEDQTLVELPISCTYDFDVAGARYLQSLDDGIVPLEFLFSGTVFYAGPDQTLRTARIPWEAEARYGMPSDVWRKAMSMHFPGSAWLRLRRDIYDRLSAMRTQRALNSWEQLFELLLADHDGTKGTAGDDD